MSLARDSMYVHNIQKLQHQAQVLYLLLLLMCGSLFLLFLSHVYFLLLLNGCFNISAVKVVCRDGNTLYTIKSSKSFFIRAGTCEQCWDEGVCVCVYSSSYSCTSSCD